MVERKSDSYYYNLVRSNIRKYRLEKNFTQAKLADEANLSTDYICEIESKKKNKSFSIATVGKISEALDVDFKNFFE
ncbi:MAG: helix-turn-helix transcriptional regulator [bacterium]|nr:helix-turn-helix transcriptional regulator [bacterium]